MLGSDRQFSPRAIESEDFPFEFLCSLGKKESWRKEVYRPIYSVHKWWAKRLGSVFRGLLLGSVLEPDYDLEQSFYKTHDFGNIVVFDPFMGSGTTIGEAHKLGMTVLGRDINPVACEAVRVALSPLNCQKLARAFDTLSNTVAPRIRTLYQGTDSRGKPCEVLYYFWVKQVCCPSCTRNVDLFNHYVFARHAYPKKKPQTQAICPFCGGIFPSLYTKTHVQCPHCDRSFNTKKGTTRGAQATCCCGETFSIARSIRASGRPPTHRLYAKLVLHDNGEKEYLPATQSDRQAYADCECLLERELEKGRVRLPNMPLEDGSNTRQAIGYNYKNWRDFFNARQLLVLSWLHEAIAQVSSPAERDALLLLFSGTLEFNNLFASYKGEGTGAVRHLFSHHVLKPERTPIEANIWGTSKSSGSFSGLYKSRLLRALEYRSHPFEVGVKGTHNKIYGVSHPIARHPIVPWGCREPGKISLSCGDSTCTGLPDASVDLVVTDPPFFDNVYYSELADFFYAWQVLHPRGFITRGHTTRRDREVQHADVYQFAEKLRAVLAECDRLLKEDGLLVFSYHHSTPNGWEALANSIWSSGFYVIRTHPVYAELAGATPKSQTKEPILFDAILVCRKQAVGQGIKTPIDRALSIFVEAATVQLRRLAAIGLVPSQGDKFVIGVAQLLAALGAGYTGEEVGEIVKTHQMTLRDRLQRLEVSPLFVREDRSHEPSYHQLSLF